MDEIKNIAVSYKDALKEDGSVDIVKLVVCLAEDISELKEQMNEKDYQILYLMRKLDEKNQ